MKSSRHPATYGRCRCCLAEGNHRELMKEYYNDGIKEVYFDMFLECYNLFLSTNWDGCNLICLKCVQKLRDANSFKMMAISTEQKLLNIINTKETIFVNVPVDDVSTETKEHVIKKEPTDVDQPQNLSYDSDNELDNDINAGDTTDKVDAERESKFLARFRSNTLKLPTRRSLCKTFPNYVRNLDMLKGQIVDSKMILKLLQENKRNKIKMKTVYVTEKLAHIINASTLLENSNIVPFKSKSRFGFPCFYCRNVFDNVESLRNHHKNEHKSVDIKEVLNGYGAEILVVYVDVTDLKCNICSASIPNINELKSHLIKTHKKKMCLEYTDRVIPFKISDGVYECQVCRFNFETFGSIERHMSVHYRNYVCKECGTGFVTKYRLKVHTKSMHVGGYFPCETCKKVFSTQQKLKMHVATVHNSIKRFRCLKCSERFTEYFQRRKHMVEIHGMAPLIYKCNVCDKTFDRRYNLTRHMKRDHFEERDFKCELCLYQCFTRNELHAHMIKHNGERIHECTVCKKSYARKKTLKEHMRIHNNDKRFTCAFCGQGFVQKCSLQGHLKTQHVDYNLQQ